ncbi:unnamed protein product [Citrullus colocynthis]|uniref:F-box protein n=1 Tax=Citrullus colocynthis TaxID=252529 RepID=A0ABP0YXJ8_9ROSI
MATISGFTGMDFFMDGSVYWETSNGVVLGFDLKYEEHGEILLPHLPPARHGAVMEMNGELCYIMVITMKKNEDENNDYYWLGMYGGGGHEMVLKRRIPLHNHNGDFMTRGDVEGEVRVLSCLSDGVVMLLVGSDVILYNVEERKGKFVGKVGPTELSGISVNDGAMRFLPYVNTLVRVCPVEEMPPEDRQFDEILKSISTLV